MVSQFSLLTLFLTYCICIWLVYLPCCNYKMAASQGFSFSYKGKEYLFVEETKKNLETLQCPVCFEIVLEPVQTSCGHLFCTKCVRGVTKCPACQEPFTSVPDHFNNRRVLSLRVKCPFTANGCKWVGDLGDVGDHVAARCKFQTKPCPYCDFTTIHKEKLQKHLTTCNSHTFRCPNGCGTAPSRRGFNQHLEECPEQLVHCKFSILGCDAVLPRKSMESHVATSAEHSTEFLLQHVVKLTDLVSQLCAKSGVSNSLEQKTWLMNKILQKEPVPPWVIKMEGFQKKEEENEEWFSDPVYSHFGGYKMRLRVDANGDGDGKGTHVSVFVYMMRGDNDDHLKWPFKGTLKVSLLNQLEDGQHHTRELWSPSHNVPETFCRRVTEGERAKNGWGYHQFIHHQDLIYKVVKNCQYLKDDTLFFRVDRFEPKFHSIDLMRIDWKSFFK